MRVARQHWLRGGEAGEVIRFERRGRNNWLVQFEISYSGGGIDGDKLWLDQSELSEVMDDDESANRTDRVEITEDRSTPINV